MATFGRASTAVPVTRPMPRAASARSQGRARPRAPPRGRGHRRLGSPVTTDFQLLSVFDVSGSMERGGYTTCVRRSPGVRLVIALNALPGRSTRSSASWFFDDKGPNGEDYSKKIVPSTSYQQHRGWTATLLGRARRSRRGRLRHDSGRRTRRSRPTMTRSVLTPSDWFDGRQVEDRVVACPWTSSLPISRRVGHRPRKPPIAIVATICIRPGRHEVIAEDLAGLLSGVLRVPSLADMHETGAAPPLDCKDGVCESYALVEPRLGDPSTLPLAVCR